MSFYTGGFLVFVTALRDSQLVDCRCCSYITTKKVTFFHASKPLEVDKRRCFQDIGNIDVIDVFKASVTDVWQANIDVFHLYSRNLLVAYVQKLKY